MSVTLPKTSVDEQWNQWCEGKKFAFLSPYQCPFAQPRRDIVNGCTGFPTLFGGADFFWFPDLKDLEDLSFLKKYTHMLYNVYPEYFPLLKRIKEQVPELVIMGITDIQTHVLAYWSLDDTKLFIESIRLYDYIFCTNMDEVEVFGACLDDPRKCQYTGWPMYQEITHYPRQIDPEKKDKYLVSLGISNPGGFNRDLLANLAVWKVLKFRFPKLHAFMYYVTPNKKAEIRETIDLYGAKDIELVDELTYNDAIRYLAQAYIAIHMYTFKVVGRLTQDCAALGVPMVGTVSNFPNRLCFPSLSVSDYCVLEAAEIATELLTSPYKYQKVREFGIAQSQCWGNEATKKRVLKVLDYESL
jgi:hypothetical protein